MSLSVRRMRIRDREAALGRIAREPRENLLLIDAVRRLGVPPSTGEPAADLLVAESEGELRGVASLQPLIAVENGVTDAVLDAFLPYFESLPSGLVKCERSRAESLWSALSASGHVASLDRIERGFAVGPKQFLPAKIPPGTESRAAEMRDLPALVEAARASLREEDRPDPFRGDPGAFRAWVASRLGRARVLEHASEICFVGYADVQCGFGWLVQGVYTPEGVRRRGFASAGVSELCHAAFAAGADHVQLAVVEGNRPAEQLYESLGFRRFRDFRTVLFG